MMIEGVHTKLERHMDPSFVYSPEDNAAFFIEETNPEGAGKAFFSSQSPCVILKAKDQAPLVWALKNKKCAEGAILVFHDDGCRLHLVELKSRLTQKDWSRALLQFQGMHLTALAAARLLGVMSFVSVTCHIGFKEDAMIPSKSSEMILMKSFVGKQNPFSGFAEWSSERIELPLFGPVPINKGQRDAHHNVDFGII